MSTRTGLAPLRTTGHFCPYLVGSYARVGEELRRYIALGFSTFILDIPKEEQDFQHIARAFDEAWAGLRDKDPSSRRRPRSRWQTSRSRISSRRPLLPPSELRMKTPELAQVMQTTEQEIVSELRRILVDSLHIALTPDGSGLVSRGLIDSLALVELLVRIEAEFGIRPDFNDLEIEDFETLEGIARFVIRSHARRALLHWTHRRPVCERRWERAMTLHRTDPAVERGRANT